MSIYKNDSDEADDIITKSLRAKPQRRFRDGDAARPSDWGSGGTSTPNPPSSGGGGTTTPPPPLPPAVKAIIDAIPDVKQRAEAQKLLTGWSSDPGKQSTILAGLEKYGVDTAAISSAYGVTPPPKNFVDNLEKVDKDNLSDVPRTAAGAVIDTIKETDYIKDRMLNNGLAPEGDLTGKFYEGVEGLSSVGTPTLDNAVKKTKDTYSDYAAAGDYDNYDYSGVMDKYDAASGYDKEDFAGVGNKYLKAGEYDKTAYDDIEGKFNKAGKYTTADFTTGDRTAEDIQKYMSPYEKLVADRQRERMKQEHEQGRGERQAQAARSGAFGGSAAAVQEHLARKEYEDKLADWNAKSLQSAFESGSGLQDKYLADIYREQAGEEASKQFGKQTELSGVQGSFAAREAAAKETAAAKQAELAGLEGLMASKTADAQETARAKEAELAGVKGLLDTSQASSQETARAKEAELAGIGGQLQSSQLLGSQGAAQKEMGLTDVAALQGAGQQQDQYAKDSQNFGLDTLQKASNIYATGVSGTPMQDQKDPSMWSNILSGVTAGAGILSTGASIGSSLGLFKEGGVVALHNALYRNRKNG
jgi:hypothetical protein